MEKKIAPPPLEKILGAPLVMVTLYGRYVSLGVEKTR